ncbi:hypothetical protein C7M84_016851 [Penaeus vannamei]|uniref:Uncharacterized protein n=1 Tax=Penaeus vannamei TaxID=6689 RepID=A0A3R7NS05_PENVA|nr:hypothetical protein C7M84_016851 [Penaeus vannamei]
MVENVGGQCGRAAVTRVASSRPCDAPAPCPAHYGLCLPVVVNLTDPANALGTVQPDKDAILDIVEANRRKQAAARTRKASGDSHSPQQTSPSPLGDSPTPIDTLQQAGQQKQQPSAAESWRIARAVQRWAQGFGKGERERDSREEERKYEEGAGTLAELAAEKRAGRAAPGPEPPTGAPRHHEAVQLFSELMQTDDVSTIAAQIANQAELIYQTWKTTGLNPTELIRYHSVTSEGSLFQGGEQSASAGDPHTPSTPSTPSPTAKPRTPARSISPAPPGSSPAVPRKVIEPSLHNGRPHSASPVRTLNTSPRPYIPPTSPRLSYASPASPSLSQGSPRPYVSPAAPQSPRGALTQPPPPPERSSSYTGVDSSPQPQAQQGQDSPFDILADPELEASLQELVNSFVIEDKARHHAAAVAALASQRPKSAPSSIQEALQRFERQMAITSRAAAHAADNVSNSSSPSASPNAMGTLGSESAARRRPQRLRLDPHAQRRRGAQPALGVTQPAGVAAGLERGPLRQHLHVAAQEQAAQCRGEEICAEPAHGLAHDLQSGANSNTTTNYITTLEARVESSSSQKFSGVPLRHKVVTMAAVDKEEERLMHALRTGTLIDDGDHLRPLGQARPTSAPVSSPQTPLHTPNSTIITSATPNSLPNQTETQEFPAQGRRPKFSISVTKVQKIASSSTSSAVEKPGSPVRMAAKNPTEGDMSIVDFAKVRFQESQQHPHSTQRLEDYRNMSKQVVSSDGRVMMARTRFENGSTSLSDSVWRGTMGIQADEVGSTLPEFYRRKLRKMRKAGSPEPLVAGSISTLPHPELTDQQKAHIRERSQSPTTGYNSAGVAIRPFLTQGSVAERVLIFERAPAEMKPKPSTGAPVPEKRRPAVNTWRDPDEVRSYVQTQICFPSRACSHSVYFFVFLETSTASSFLGLRLRRGARYVLAVI